MVLGGAGSSPTRVQQSFDLAGSLPTGLPGLPPSQEQPEGEDADDSVLNQTQLTTTTT